MKKIRITPTVQDEVEPAIEDSLARQAKGESQVADSLYIKIHAACEALKKSGPVTVELDDDELHELKDRAEYQLECVVPDNLPCSDPCERAYWLGRKRAYTALLKQF